MELASRMRRCGPAVFRAAVPDAGSPALCRAALGLGTGVLSFHLFEDPVGRGLDRAWSRRGSSAGAVQPLSLPADGKAGAAKPEAAS